MTVTSILKQTNKTNQQTSGCDRASSADKVSQIPQILRGKKCSENLLMPTSAKCRDKNSNFFAQASFLLTGLPSLVPNEFCLLHFHPENGENTTSLSSAALHPSRR